MRFLRPGYQKRTSDGHVEGCLSSENEFVANADLRVGDKLRYFACGDQDVRHITLGVAGTEYRISIPNDTPLPEGLPLKLVSRESFGVDAALVGPSGFSGNARACVYTYVSTLAVAE